MSAAAGFLLTWNCYGHWLPGREGFVDRKLNQFNGPLPGPNETNALWAARHMRQAPYLLDAASRDVVVAAIEEICSLKGWILSAAHARTNHVHVVAATNREPEGVMRALKAYCSCQLNLRDGNVERRRWARHGSTRYLWTNASVQAAIEYVVRQQGEAMAVFEATPRFAQGSD